MPQDQTIEQEVATENARAAAAEQSQTVLEDESAPPPGYNRNEALRKQADALARQAEELLGQIEVGTADPAKLKVDREVRAAINEYNEVYVSNADTNYKYAWVFRDPHGEYGGRAVRKMQALGWEVVKGDMPEAQEHNHIEGRVVADCLLMRCRLDHWMVLQKRDRLLRQAQQAGVYANLYDVADQAGVRVWGGEGQDIPDFVNQAVSGQADQRRARALGQYHRLNSSGAIDRMLRQGAIPGVPIRTVAAPGRVR